MPTAPLSSPKDGATAETYGLSLSCRCDPAFWVCSQAAAQSLLSGPWWGEHMGTDHETVRICGGGLCGEPRAPSGQFGGCLSEASLLTRGWASSWSP